MYCKLITENDCAVNAVLSCTPVEFLIINKAIARCSNDEFYTESDRRTMVLMGEAMKNFEQVEVADTPQTESQNSNKNSNVISVYDGVSEAVRCAMCSNPNKSDRGCDGACSYDEKLYERIMKAIAESVADTPQTDNGIGCSRCESRYDCYDRNMPHAVRCNNYGKITDEPQTDCGWK